MNNLKLWAVILLCCFLPHISTSWFTWSDNWATLHLAYVNNQDISPDQQGASIDGITAALPLTVRVQITNDELWDVEFNKVHLQYKVLGLTEPAPAACPNDLEETYRIDFHFEDTSGMFGNYNGMDYVIVSTFNPCVWAGRSNTVGLDMSLSLDVANGRWTVSSPDPIDLFNPYKTTGTNPSGTYNNGGVLTNPPSLGIVSNIVVEGDPGGGGTWRNFGHVYNSDSRTFQFSPNTMPLGSQHLTINHPDISYGASLLIRIYAANTLTDPPYENASLDVDTDENGTNGWKDYWVVLVHLAERTRPRWMFWD